MFDPEKVERLSAGDEELVPDPKGAFVWFRDYDQLLELYREAREGRESFAKGIMTMRQHDPQTP